MIRRPSLWLSCVVVLAQSCAGPRTETAVTPAAQPSAAQPSAPTTSSRESPSAPAEPASFSDAPELGVHFEREGVGGAAAIWRDLQSVPRCYGAELCSRGFLPASTFKIPNTLIGLETGVIPDVDFALRWDGQRRWFEDWNRDHDLRSAMRFSVVWFYQEVARRIGNERMHDWIQRLNFGNRAAGPELDTFWLIGDLRINALQQLDFLRRLREGRLPVTERSSAIVRELLHLDDSDEWTQYGKTGWYQPEPNISLPEHPTVGWLVGWVERANTPIGYYAVLVVDPPEGADMRALRPRLTKALLRAEQLWPAE